MIKRYSHIIISLFVALLFTSCGNSDTFRVNGTIEGLGTRNLKFYYFNGSALQIGVASAINDNFTFEGRTEKPALITIITNQTVVIGHLIAQNGDDIECKFSVSDPYKIEIDGNDDAECLARFITDNQTLLLHDNSDDINAAIESEIARGEKNLLAAALFAIYYDSNRNPVRADSVLLSINEEYRPAQIVEGYTSMLLRFESDAKETAVMPMSLYCKDDSLTTFSPKDSNLSLLFFHDAEEMRKDSVKNAIDSLGKKYAAKKLAILNIGLQKDTAEWKKSIADAPLSGKELWTAGAVASPQIRKLNIQRLPLFILCDSVGSQKYRGTSVTTLCDSIAAIADTEK